MKDEKRGRGRPSVWIRETGKDDVVTDLYGENTKRTQAAVYYRGRARVLLSEAASDIQYLDGIYNKEEIMEQLGRMYSQDRYSNDDIFLIARIAAKAYHDGATVKQIKRYILTGRTSGVWNH